MHFVTWLVIPLALSTLYFGWEALHPHDEDPHIVQTSYDIASRFSPQFAASRAASKPPASAFDEKTGRYNFGRFTRPIANTNHQHINPIQEFTQDKNFVWVGITQGHNHISVGLLQFHYTSAAVISVYDSIWGQSWSVYRDMPFPISKLWGPEFHPGKDGMVSVLSGCVNFTDSTGFVSICFDNGAVRVAFDLILGNDVATMVPVAAHRSVRAKASCWFDICVGYFPNMVLPLGAKRAATVSKIAGHLTKEGFLSVTDAVTGDFVLTTTLGYYALAALDYTRGLLRRETRWKWMSFSQLLHVNGGSFPYGMHISTDTYDFGADGAGAENSVFGVNHRGEPSFRFLDMTGIKIVKDLVMEDPNKTRWFITGPSGLNLTFTPHGGTFRGSIHLGIVDAELWHMWGVFNGSAPQPTGLYSDDGTVSRESLGNRNVVEIVSAPGVLEDHYALW